MTDTAAQSPVGSLLAAVEGLPDGVVLLDRDWIYRYVNPSAAGLLGRSVQDLLGGHYPTLYPEALGTPFQQAYARVMSTGVAESLDEHYEPWDRWFRNRVIGVPDGILIVFSDVTDERRQVAKVHADLALLQQVVDFAPVGIALADLDGRLRLVNRYAADAVGADPAQLAGRTAAACVPAETGRHWVAASRRVRASERSESLEVEEPDPEHGAPRYHEAVVFPTYDDAGRETGTGIVYRDVTDRRQAAQRLAEAERRYQDMFEQASLGLLVTRADGSVLDANRAACAMLGRPREDVVGRTVAELGIASGLQPPETGAEREHVAELTTGDGRRVAVALRGETVVRKDGDPLTTVTMRDVSALRVATAERERALAELGAANAAMVRFRALVEASADFIAIAAVDGSVTYLNPAGRQLIGMEPQVDVTGTTISDYLTEQGQRASVELEQPAVLRDGRWTGESTLRDWRGGPPIPVSISSFLMHHPETGEPFALATVQRDIRDRVAAEQQLAEAAAQRHALLTRLVEAQERERARIAADVHDDSVQAMAAVDLRLGLLHRLLAEDATTSAPVLALVEQVQDVVGGATDRLRRLLFDLEPPTADVPLTDALREAAAHLLELGPATFTLDADENADLPYPERVKAVRIAREALGNAAQHSGARAVAVSVRRRGGGVEISVTDDGVGLASETAVSPPGHRGLATMRDRAAIAGGWWRVEPVEPHGTRVRFWLPGSSPE